MNFTTLAVIAAFLGTAAPAAAFWGSISVAEPHTMLALGAALVIAASYSRSRRKPR